MDEQLTTVDAQLERIALAMESIVEILQADSGSKKSVTLTKGATEDEPKEEIKLDKSAGDDDAEH